MAVVFLKEEIWWPVEKKFIHNILITFSFIQRVKLSLDVSCCRILPCIISQHAMACCTFYLDNCQLLLHVCSTKILILFESTDIWVSCHLLECSGPYLHVKYQILLCYQNFMIQLVSYLQNVHLANHRISHVSLFFFFFIV